VFFFTPTQLKEESSTLTKDITSTDTDEQPQATRGKESHGPSKQIWKLGPEIIGQREQVILVVIVAYNECQPQVAKCTLINTCNSKHNIGVDNH